MTSSRPCSPTSRMRLMKASMFCNRAPVGTSMRTLSSSPSRQVPTIPTSGGHSLLRSWPRALSVASPVSSPRISLRSVGLPSPRVPVPSREGWGYCRVSLPRPIRDLVTVARSRVPGHGGLAARGWGLYPPGEVVTHVASPATLDGRDRSGDTAHALGRFRVVQSLRLLNARHGDLRSGNGHGSSFDRPAGRSRPDARSSGPS